MRSGGRCSPSSLRVGSLLACQTKLLKSCRDTFVLFLLLSQCVGSRCQGVKVASANRAQQTRNRSSRTRALLSSTGTRTGILCSGVTGKQNMLSHTVQPSEGKQFKFAEIKFVTKDHIAHLRNISKQLSSTRKAITVQGCWFKVVIIFP